MKTSKKKHYQPEDGSHSSLKKEGNSHFSKDNSIPFFNKLIIQPKSPADDHDEAHEKNSNTITDQEAQQVSSNPLSNPENHSTPFFNNRNRFIQRKCAECEKEEKLQKKSVMIQMEGESGVPSVESSTSKVEVSSPSIKESSTATQTDQQGQFIVEDSAVAQAGQMRKSDFLEHLNTEVCASVDDALKGSPFSSNSCPYIRSAFACYQNSSALQLEQTVRRYEPATRSAQSAQDMIQQVKAHVSAAATRWLQTGDLSDVPKEIADQIPDSVKTLVGNAGTVSNLTQSVGSTIGGIASGIGSVASSIGSMFFKSDAGDAHSTQSPHSVMQNLGKGHTMDGGSKGKMESAFGISFSNVEIHNDSNAANLSKNMNARAFAVGNHIAFANGEYNPGTLVGDALMAHELAHVQQQSEMNSTDHHSYDSLERDADDTAVGVITKMMTSKDSDQLKKGKGLKSGLRLSRCNSSSKTPATADKGAGVANAGKFNPLTGIYTAAEGDTGPAIASRFGTTVDIILKNNLEIKDPASIVAGQKIFIPSLITPKDPSGDVSHAWTVDDYVKQWEADKGRKITAAEKDELARGCVGISSIQIGADPLDTLDRCYDSFENALRVARADNEKFRNGGLDKKKKSIIFSMRFWSGGKSYDPDKSGKVDMSDYNTRLTSGDAWKPKPGGGTYVNFDFGYYNETTGMWWHANHSEPGMKIYESTLEHYSRKLADFDRQIFCVATVDLS